MAEAKDGDEIVEEAEEVDDTEDLSSAPEGTLRSQLEPVDVTEDAVLCHEYKDEEEEEADAAADAAVVVVEAELE